MVVIVTEYTAVALLCRKTNTLYYFVAEENAESHRHRCFNNHANIYVFFAKSINHDSDYPQISTGVYATNDWSSVRMLTVDFCLRSRY